MKREFPPLTQEPIRHVDATPDENYPIRILKAYLYNAQCKWATGSDGSCENELLKLMNECANKRAALLEHAIAILEAHHANR